MPGQRRHWPYVVLGLLVALGLVVWFLAPRIITSRAVMAIQQSGRYEATLGGQSIAWTGGTTMLRDVRVVDKATGTTVFEAPRIDLGWGWRSLVLLKPHVSARVDHPKITAGRVKKPKAQATVDLRAYLLHLHPFVVDRFELTDGQVSAYVPRLRRTVRMTDVDVLATGVTNRPAPRGQMPTDITLRARLEGGLVAAHLVTDALGQPPACELHLDATGLPRDFAPHLEKLGVTTAGGTSHLQLSARLVDGHYDGRVRAGVSHVTLEATPGGGPLRNLRKLLAAGGTKVLGGSKEEGTNLQNTATFKGTLSSRDKTLPAALQEMLVAAARQLAKVSVQSTLKGAAQGVEGSGKSVPKELPLGRRPPGR